jgi:hypothetical protein
VLPWGRGERDIGHARGNGCGAVGRGSDDRWADDRGAGKKLTGASWGQGFQGVVPVNLGAPEEPEPVEPGRSFMTMQEGLPQGGLEEGRGSRKGESSQGWRLLEQGLR